VGGRRKLWASLYALLIVEDSEDDADQLLRVLRPAGYEPAYEIVDTLPAMRTALEHKDWDVITSDHFMPQFSAPPPWRWPRNYVRTRRSSSYPAKMTLILPYR